MKKGNIITIWGLLDLSSLGWYIGWRICHMQVPFYHDISESLRNTTSFGLQSLSIITIISLLLYISLAVSGVLLIRKNRIGATISYIQAPFRLLTLIPPSIFFILWPLKYTFSNPKAVTAIITLVVLVLLSEALKLYSVITWHKQNTTA